MAPVPVRLAAPTPRLKQYRLLDGLRLAVLGSMLAVLLAGGDALGRTGWAFGIALAGVVALFDRRSRNALAYVADKALGRP